MYKVECMYKVVPGAAGRHRRNHCLQLFSSRGPRCSHCRNIAQLLHNPHPMHALSMHAQIVDLFIIGTEM